MPTENASVRSRAIAACGALAIAFAAGLGACSGSSSNPTTDDVASGDDGGADDAATNPGADPAFSAPATCTSNATWDGGDLGDETMHPGRACITCHKQKNGPTLSIAGTVFPTAHEPDDCDGLGTGVTIAITDAKGVVTVLAPDSAGNFLSRAVIAMPFHAKVMKNGKERAMGASQQNGDCNFCHTQTGANNAPGRIIPP